MAHLVLDTARRRPGLGPQARLRRAGTRIRLSLAAGIRLNEPVVVCAVATLLLSVYFVALPGVDVAVSALFHDAQAGFALAADPVLKALRKSSTYALASMVLVLLAAIGFGLGRHRDLGRRLRARRALVLLAGLAIGPGLIVNGILKSLWGRPRPIQTDLFGGEAAFSPAWAISDACADNCSFVSGEASSAAWLVIAVAVMSPPAWRRWTLPVAAIYGVALSLNRLAFGGHYLSDIVLSWGLTALVLAVLCRLTMNCPVKARRARRARRIRTATAAA